MRRHAGYSLPQRGVAALEFALTVPALLALFAGTIYIGLAILARIELTEAATQAVRTCVLQQLGYANREAYRTCAEEQFANLITQFPSVCDDGSPVVKASTATRLDGSIPAIAGSPVYLLQLQVSCKKRLSPLLNVSGKGSVPGTITLGVTAGMPFVQVNSLR